MKPLLWRVCVLALWCASWIVPGDDRSEWLREWKAELWHIIKLQPARTAAAFTAGAFRDAYLLRTDLRQMHRHRSLSLVSSPIPLLLLLLLATGTSVGLAFLLPAVRPVVAPVPYRDARTLVVISRDGTSHSPSPSISLGEFRYWQRAAQGIFSDLAFYQIVRKELHLGHGCGVELSVARASGNLAALLQTEDFPETGDTDTPRLVLSDAAWRRYFHADPHVAGRTVFLLGEKAIVAGVAGADAWRLPGKADVWLLESDSRMEALSAYSAGFVVARMQPALARDPREDSWHMTVPQGDGGTDGFTCVSVNRHVREPFVLLGFITFLALLALPATTPLPLGEYPYNPRKQSVAVRLRRWLFLAAKVAVIPPLVCFTALDLGQVFPEAQFVFAFVAMLAAFRWILRDQRQRCPVCLELLRNPVRVGQPSRNFLAWNGTELICVVGHGFLHVPEMPTSWFSTQRWLYLDASWKSIFSPQEMARSA